MCEYTIVLSRDCYQGDDSVVDCVNNGTGRVLVQSSYNFEDPVLYNAPLPTVSIG
jgi:hypothetical protein